MRTSLKKKPQADTGEFPELLRIQQHTTVFLVVGLSPLIYNAVSEKAQRELLLPAGRKNAAARAQTLKHDPLAEYRNSVYRTSSDDEPTRLYFPASAFKRAMSTAALDIPGATKASVGRLSWVTGDKISIYGVPQLHMGIVRSADMNKTPDVRTRAILPRWACAIRVNFVHPQLSERNVIHLFSAAGILCGVGDFRQEKGAGSFGQFKVVEPDDPELAEIMREGGREAQDAALAEPMCYDEQTLSLYTWATETITQRREDMEAGRKTAEPEEAPETWDVNPVPLSEPSRVSVRRSPPPGAPDEAHLAEAAVSGKYTPGNLHRDRRPRGRPRKNGSLLLP